MSKSQPITLEGFKLFYEELLKTKPSKQRLRRPRASAKAN